MLNQNDPQGAGEFPQCATEIRIPARLMAHYSTGALKIWLYARALDSTGAGRTSFAVADAALHFETSERSIRRWLSDAREQELFRHYQTKGGEATCCYASLKRAAARAGLKDLGEIAECSLEELKNLTPVAIESVAQGLQSASYHAAKLAQQELGNRKPRMTKPHDIRFEPSGHPFGHGTRVLETDDRFVYVSEGFICYGGSQKRIAERVGRCVRTVQRYLSNPYRLNPSPVRNRRAGLSAIGKRQIAQKRHREVDIDALRFGAKRAGETCRYIEKGGRVFHLKNNIYEPSQVLVPCRYRRKAYKRYLTLLAGRQGIREPYECDTLRVERPILHTLDPV